MTNIKTELERVVQDEIKIIDTLMKMISAERQALEKSDSESLYRLAQEKNNLFLELEELANNHFQLLHQLGFEANQSGISEYIKSLPEHDPMLKAISELQEKLILCQNENLVNGNIITIQKRHTDQLLNLLYDRGEPQTYNQKGELA